MKKLAIAVLVVFFAVSQGTAHADMVKGNVASIDNAAKSLTINRVNATTGAEEQVAI